VGRYGRELGREVGCDVIRNAEVHGAGEESDAEEHSRWSRWVLKVRGDFQSSGRRATRREGSLDLEERSDLPGALGPLLELV